MIKLWLMISHMSFMSNEWNVPPHWHIIVPHHVLNNYCSEWLIRNDLGLLVILIFYDWNISHKLSYIFEIFFNVMTLNLIILKKYWASFNALYY